MCLAGVPASEAAVGGVLAVEAVVGGDFAEGEMCLAGVPTSEASSKNSFPKYHEVVAVTHNQREHGTGDAIKRDGFEQAQRSLAAVLASEVAREYSCAQVTVRDKSAKDFSKSEAELVGVADTFQRAISIIEKEMAKEPAFLQKRIDTPVLSLP